MHDINICRWSLEVIFNSRIQKLKKSNMVTRRPFWKWRCWKSIGFCLWPQSTCIWNSELKFQSKLDLCSWNHAACRVQKLKKPIWLPDSHFENDVAEDQWVPTHIHDINICRWSLKLIFTSKVKSGNQKIQYGRQAAILNVMLLKINRLLLVATINMYMKLEILITKQTWLMLRKPFRLQTDGRADGRTDGRTRWIQYTPPSNFVGRGYKNRFGISPRRLDSIWGVRCYFTLEEGT